MATASFRRFQPIVINGRTQILHSRAGDVWHLKDPTTGEITQQPLSCLLKAYADGNVTFLIKDRLPSAIEKELLRSEPRGKPDNVADDEWKLALAKLGLVKEVCGLGWQSAVQKIRIAELWPALTKRLGKDVAAPDASTVHRWWTRLRECGWDGRALLPMHWKKGRKSAEVPDELLGLVEEGVEESYLTEERRTREEAHEAVGCLVLARNNANPHLDPLPYATKRQVDRYINSLGAFDVYGARYGHQAAIVKFRAVHGKAIATAPLERVELDHTLLDLIVLDDETLIPLGRPTLAIALDAYTRCVLGFCIGFEPPSISTVGQCLRSAFTPKDGLLQSVPGLENRWECFGKMESLVLDQALENKSKFMFRLSLMQFIELIFCPRKTPWFKARIERFLGTLNSGFCHNVAGKTFSNVAQKGDYDAVGKAVCTRSALRTALIQWIVDKYHVRRHRTLQMSPIGLWRASITEDDIPLAADLTSIETSLRESVSKPLTHKGIEINNLLYNSNDLTDLRLKYGAELTVIAYPSSSDLGDIIVEHELSNSTFVVPCLDQEYARGLTLWQHKAIRKFAKQRDMGIATFEQRLRARAALEATIYEGMADCPLKVRVREARLLQRQRSDEGGPTPRRSDSKHVEQSCQSNIDDDEFDENYVVGVEKV